MRLSEVRALVGVQRPELKAVPRRLAACHDIDDLRRAASRVVPRPVFDYVDGGADEEVSLAGNQAAFWQWRFMPRTLAGTGSVDTSARVFGADLSMPLGLAPTGYTRMMHPAGEIAVVRSARRHGLPYTLSTMATTAIEDLPPGGFWFQLYVQRDVGLTKELVSRAEAAECPVLMVSTDVTVPGHRLRDERNGLVIPPRLTPGTLAGIAVRPGYWIRMLSGPGIGFANFASQPKTIARSASFFDPAIDWDTISQLRSLWPRTLVLKGPLGPADARRALAAGVDGLVLSNHGGRQLDRTAAPVELLPLVRAEVGPAMPLLVDSGVRHGADIAVAIALGADAALIGRAYLYGLMAGGELGVDRALDLLAAQFVRTLHLLGIGSVAELRATGRELVTKITQELYLGSREGLASRFLPPARSSRLSITTAK
ncbi:MAG: alpha-hydroxy acid oxidase [Streptosporangiaceae bacterium]|jgi:L-lactate dehydrogenase (cytochrome)